MRQRLSEWSEEVTTFTPRAIEAFWTTAGGIGGVFALVAKATPRRRKLDGILEGDNEVMVMSTCSTSLMSSSPAKFERSICASNPASKTVSSIETD